MSTFCEYAFLFTCGFVCATLWQIRTSLWKIERKP